MFVSHIVKGTYVLPQHATKQATMVVRFGFPPKSLFLIILMILQTLKMSELFLTHVDIYLFLSIDFR